MDCSLFLTFVMPLLRVFDLSFCRSSFLSRFRSFFIPLFILCFPCFFNYLLFSSVMLCVSCLLISVEVVVRSLVFLSFDLLFSIVVFVSSCRFVAFPFLRSVVLSACCSFVVLFFLLFFLSFACRFFLSFVLSFCLYLCSPSCLEFYLSFFIVSCSSCAISFSLTVFLSFVISSCDRCFFVNRLCMLCMWFSLHFRPCFIFQSCIHFIIWVLFRLFVFIFCLFLLYGLFILCFFSFSLRSVIS